METLVQEVEPFEGSLGPAPSFRGLPLGRRLRGVAHPAGQGPGSTWGSRSLWELRVGALNIAGPLWGRTRFSLRASPGLARAGHDPWA